MITKQLCFLAALTLCCCIVSLHASPVRGCRCLRAISSPIPRRVIEKIEVFPISGYCRRIEIIVYRRNGSKVCVSPRTVWINNLLNNSQTKNETINSTTVSPTASTINF